MKTDKQTLDSPNNGAIRVKIENEGVIQRCVTFDDTVCGMEHKTKIKRLRAVLSVS